MRKRTDRLVAGLTALSIMFFMADMTVCAADDTNAPTYSEMTLAQQREAMKTDPQVLRFQKAREARAADPYRPLYHFSTPERLLNDPNGLFWWNGYYHMFYQLYPAANPRVHWAHAYSEDLVHWKDLPLAIAPEGGGDIFSGQVLAEEDRVIAMYHATGTGLGIATATDPLLLDFQKHVKNPVIPDALTYSPLNAPCIWKEADGYYAVSGSYKGGKGRRGGYRYRYARVDTERSRVPQTRDGYSG